MINLPLNFSAPTGQVQNTYAQPARTNQYLIPSQYEGMQLHTPSGLFYQGGTLYEPYTSKPVQKVMNNFGVDGMGGMRVFVNNNANKATSRALEKPVQIGGQYFKPFTGNANGIVDGNLSMVSMLNQQPLSQPQGIPNNLFNFLSSPNMQPTNNQQGSGAGRFLGLLGSPITTNTQGK
jgi:hypothetical protein